VSVSSTLSLLLIPKRPKRMTSSTSVHDSGALPVFELLKVINSVTY
jgi:hypothetical protein